MVKIVLTGGPCAGKTTILSKLSQILTQRGYKTIFLNESASELILNGIAPGGNIPLDDFQGFCLDTQLSKEKLYDNIVKYYDSNKVVIFYDRGICDQMAYMGRDAFEKLLNTRGLTVSEAMNRYDAVLHLVTAADGAVEYYQWNDPTKEETGNNAARRESPEEAIAMDKKTLNAWTGHSHLRVFDNSTNFDEKVQRVIEEVFSILGEPKPYEVERKYLIKMPSIADLEALKCKSKYQIVQTYLNAQNGLERRVRQRGDNKEGFSFYYAEKEDVEFGIRIEREKRISMEEYIKYLLDADISLHQIIKTRYCFVYNQKYFELDIYPFDSEYAILEVEVNNLKEEIQLPDFKIIAEVTGIEKYKNFHISKTMSIKP